MHHSSKALTVLVLIAILLILDGCYVRSYHDNRSVDAYPEFGHDSKVLSFERIGKKDTTTASIEGQVFTLPDTVICESGLHATIILKKVIDVNETRICESEIFGHKGKFVFSDIPAGTYSVIGYPQAAFKRLQGDTITIEQGAIMKMIIGMGYKGQDDFEKIGRRYYEKHK